MRKIALLIAVIMLISMLPAGALADDDIINGIEIIDTAVPAGEEAPAEKEAPVEDVTPAKDEIPAEKEAAEDETSEEEEEEIPAEDEEEVPAEDETPAEEAEEEADAENEEEIPAEEEDEVPAEGETPAEDEEEAPAEDETPEEEPMEEEPEEVSFLLNAVAKTGAELREAPSGDSRVLCTVAEEVSILIVGSVGDWFHTEIDENDGYLHRDDIIFDVEEEQEEPAEEEPAEEVPADEEPAEEVEAPAENEFPAEDEDFIEIDDYETPLGLAGMTEEATEDVAEIAEEEAQEEDEEENVISSGVKIGAAIRTKSDGMAPVILTVKSDTKLTLGSQVDDDWYEVALDEEIEGYISGYIYKDDVIREVTAEKPEEAEKPAETEVEETPKKVTIFTSRKVVMKAGEPVYLTSKLEGFEDCEEIYYVWEVDKGNGFEEVEGATEDTYTFEATAETLSWGWRLVVLSI